MCVTAALVERRPRRLCITRSAWCALSLESLVQLWQDSIVERGSRCHHSRLFGGRHLLQHYCGGQLQQLTFKWIE